jgi:seryl-tRNA synthetase
MLTIQFIKENHQEVVDRLKIKNFDAAGLVHEIINLDTKRRDTQKSLDDVLSESKLIAKEIGQFMKLNQVDEAEKLKAKTFELKELSKSLGDLLNETEKALLDKQILLPNLPHKSVKPGKGELDNEIIENVGNIPQLAENAVPHWDLATKYDLIDFELGNKLTGAGFPVYKGKGAKLQRGLINFFLDEAIDAGYNEILPPLLVNEDSGYGTGQLPDKEGQMYYVGIDNLYLIPTAEVPVTNIYRDVILKASELPKKNVAFSSCFRREAGSYGKDVRGLNRLHQFEKVEIVQIQHPDKSYATLEEMREHVASLLQKLELPYRVLRLCGGDISFTSALTYDFEVYSAAQKRWLEVSSVSNFETFQSNRMKLRFKDENGKNQFPHTLNGSALALPRILAALLENNQTEEGIKIPKVLQAFTRFDIIN